MVDRVLQLPFPQARSHRGDKGFVVLCLCCVPKSERILGNFRIDA